MMRRLRMNQWTLTVKRHLEFELRLQRKERFSTLVKMSSREYVVDSSCI